ncbi:cystin-1 [Patagioenas fasciata]|uniref:cystin-1 n=1 Tax=Patagioenas fasciata TaxID=372321 RepID=UPI0032E8B25A
MGSGSSRRRGAAAGAAGGQAVPSGGAAAENRELLEKVLAECEEAAALPAPARRAPAGSGVSPPRDAGSCGDAAAGGGGGSPHEQAALLTRSSQDPETTNNHQCPQRESKKPAGQSTISYDYSEEELMASIEREYGR